MTRGILTQVISEFVEAAYGRQHSRRRDVGVNFIYAFANAIWMVVLEMAHL